MPFKPFDNIYIYILDFFIPFYCAHCPKPVMLTPLNHKCWECGGAGEIWGKHPCPCHGPSVRLYSDTSAPLFNIIVFNCHFLDYQPQHPSRATPNPALGISPCGSFIENSPELINWLHWLHFTTHTFPGLSFQRSGWPPLSSIYFIWKYQCPKDPLVSKDGFSIYPNHPGIPLWQMGLSLTKNTQFSQNGTLPFTTLSVASKP